MGFGFGLQLLVAFGEGVGDVLEEDEAEDHVLVLGGVHVAAEAVGHGPELAFEVEGCSAGCGGIGPFRCARHGLVPSQVHGLLKGSITSETGTGANGFDVDGLPEFIG